MAQTLKILGQSAPLATTETDLYTVPGATSTAVSSVVICNRGSTNTTFRIYVAIAAAVTANKQYLYYDTTVLANDSFTAVLGITLATTDVLRVYAGNGNLSFNVFGAENS